MDIVKKLRLWINDRNSDDQVFTDEELEAVLTWHSTASCEQEIIDLARADCLDMIANDIRRWNSYSAGGLSENFTGQKELLFQTARTLRQRWGFKGGDFR